MRKRLTVPLILTRSPAKRDFKVRVNSRIWFTDAGVSEDAMAAIEPAVRSPGKGVEGFVGVFVMPAVEEDLRFGVGDVVVVFVGYEH